MTRPALTSRLIAWFEYDAAILQNPCPLHGKLSAGPCKFEKNPSARKPPE